MDYLTLIMTTETSSRQDYSLDCNKIRIKTIALYVAILIVLAPQKLPILIGESENAITQLKIILNVARNSAYSLIQRER